MKHVEIFTDGACRGNPGPGGWGALLRYAGTERELHGGEPHTTNNRMELTAAIRALAALRRFPCASEKTPLSPQTCAPSARALPRAAIPLKKAALSLF